VHYSRQMARTAQEVAKTEKRDLDIVTHICHLYAVVTSLSSGRP